MTRWIPILSLLVTSVARAECPEIQANVEHFSPPNDATGVPVNGVIAFGTAPAFADYDPAVALAVTGSAGGISGALIAGPAESWLFLPDADLAPSKSYTAIITDALGNGATKTITFTTVAGEDVTDPLLSSAPTLTLGSYIAPVRTEDCQLPGYWSVLADWPDAVDAGPVLYSLQVDIVDLIDPGFVPSPRALTATESQRALAVPELAELTVSVFAIDQAGRQAHTVQSVMQTPEAPIGGGGGGCACSLDAESRASAAWLGMMLAVGLLIVTQRALHKLLG